MLPLLLVLLLIEALELDRFMRGRMPDSMSSFWLLWSPAQRMRGGCFSGGWLPDILEAVVVGVMLRGEEGEGDEDGNK